VPLPIANRYRETTPISGKWEGRSFPRGAPSLGKGLDNFDRGPILKHKLAPLWEGTIGEGGQTSTITK